MNKLRLLSAASVLAMGVALAGTPAQAFDNVYWGWNNDTITDLDAYFDIRVDFDPTGLTQLERLQVMAGSMTAMADGSGAYYGGTAEGYSAAVPVINITQSNSNDTVQKNTSVQLGAAIAANLASQEVEAELASKDNGKDDKSGGINGGIDIEQKLTQSADAMVKQDADLKNINANFQGNFLYVDLGDFAKYQAEPVDALKHLASVEIAATAVSNIGTVDSEHATFVHDGQIAFGGFKPVQGGLYDDTQDQAQMASAALGNWIGQDIGWDDTSADDRYGTSGNRNFDMTMLAWTSAQYGLIKKGYNSAIALGDSITNAQASVDATAASNIHTVTVKPLNEPEEGYGWHKATDSDNVAVVDLNQFGYSDNFALASATNHMITGYKNLGKLDAPVLKVSATALGNVSSVTNKFGGGAE